MTDIPYSLNISCTLAFEAWINRLDRSLRIRVDQRVQRLADGNPGFHRRFDNILEVKWKTGSMGSFRLYCVEMNGVVLLLGGHKDSQVKDIEASTILLRGVKSGKVRIKNYE